jgi:hypothetical protein
MLPLKHVICLSHSVQFVRRCLGATNLSFRRTSTSTFFPVIDLNTVRIIVVCHLIAVGVDLDTYVNYEQNEETMMAEAIERSMLTH